MDVLSASSFDHKITWYKNDGNENFTPYTITTSAEGAQSVYAVDVDGDGNMDVLSASFFDRKIAWYENLWPTKMAENPQNYIPFTLYLSNNYPNPFNPITTIEYGIPNYTNVKIEAYNVQGRRLKILVDAYKPAGTYKVIFDADGLASGVYLYRIQAVDPSTGSGQVFVDVKKMVLLR
jgi:hypothetical protein